MGIENTQGTYSYTNQNGEVVEHTQTEPESAPGTFYINGEEVGKPEDGNEKSQAG